MNRIIIAVDGPSSSGKSTFAKMIAKRYGYRYIDTGAMYRAVTLYALRHGFFNGGEPDKKALIASLPDIHIDFSGDGTNDLLLNGENVEREIRGLGVSSHVSRVSEVAEVRAALLAKQQEMGREKGIVMDGRDIGTTVFPAAEIKIFLTAPVEVRAERRYKEYIGKGVEADLEEIKRGIAERDRLDETREISPLRKADDALLLDNSRMALDEQMQWIERAVSTKIDI